MPSIRPNTSRRASGALTALASSALALATAPPASAGSPDPPLTEEPGVLTPKFGYRIVDAAAAVAAPVR